MESTRLLMTAAGKNSFSFEDGYTGVSIEDLYALLQLARQTMNSLERELASRPTAMPTSSLSPGVWTCVEKLTSALDRLNDLQRVEDATGLIAKAAKIMKSPQPSRRAAAYRQFLIDVANHCSPGTALLCAKALGMRRVAELNKGDAAALLRYLRHNSTTFKSSALEEYATGLRLVQSASVSGNTPAEHETGARKTAQRQSAAEPTRDPSRSKRRCATIIHFIQANRTMKKITGIQYLYSNGPRDKVHLCGIFSKGILGSNQWQSETNEAATDTICIAALIPSGLDEDMTITLYVGRLEGSELLEQLMLRPSWSRGSGPTH